MVHHDKSFFSKKKVDLNQLNGHLVGQPVGGSFHWLFNRSNGQSVSRPISRGFSPFVDQSVGPSVDCLNGTKVCSGCMTNKELTLL